MTEPTAPHLLAVTYPFDQLDVLLERTSAIDPLVWGRGDDLMVGFGDTLRLSFEGPTRIADAAAAWQRLVAAAEIDDPVQVPGTGLVAFGSFTFADDSSQTSVLRVPRFVFGRRDDRRFITEIRLSTEPSEALPAPTSIRDGVRVSWQPTRDAEAHQAAVRGALSYIQSGSVHKVVLARSVSGEISEQTDLRAPIARLAERYPDTWLFAIDGLIGASPETLVAAHEHTATIRVLAGTLDREGGSVDQLLGSAKDQVEHQFAVDSVVDALHSYGVSDERVSDTFALELPELWHLASDIDFSQHTIDLLRLVGELHPTAAVAGSPTEAALKVISAFETIDRGRYAGPVGWIDAAGNGEWAIALRCAQVAGTTVTASAGGGIVASSDPALEFAETELKLRTIRSAF